MKENKKIEMTQEEIEERCFKVIKVMVPEAEYNDLIKGCIDDLDFIELLMDTEVEFDCSIDEGITSIDEFKTVKDLVEWVATKI